MANGDEWVATAYGLATVGAVPVLLNTFASIPEVAASLELAGARLLVTTTRVGNRHLLDELVAAAPDLAAGDGNGDGGGPGDGDDDGGGLAGVEQVLCHGLAEPVGRVRPWASLLAAGAGVTGADVAAARDAVDPDDDGLVLFTSGTSGVPKAVLHRQSSSRLQQVVWATMHDIRPDERVFSTYPWCWSSGFVRSLGACLSVGACLVTVDHFEPAAALALMATERVTMAVLPGQGHLDLRLVEAPEFAGTDLGALERPTNAVLANAIGQPPWRPTGYGLSETFTLVTASPADGSHHEPPGSSGKVLPGWTVKVTDPDTGAVVERGTVGQFRVRGPALMKEYCGRPPGTGFDDEGFFVTPDTGRLDDDGFLYFAARVDDVVRSAGVNVSTAELEAELAGLAGVRIPIVLGVPHPTLGQALVACLVVDDRSLGPADVVDWLRPRVASYKLPRAVLFFEESELSYTVSQKVQRAALREAALERIGRDGLW
jgi:fatty-acyl-CoA synthase